MPILIIAAQSWSIRHSFEIISYNSYSNNFSSITGLDIDNRIQFNVKYNDHGITVITTRINSSPNAVNDTVNLLEDTPISIAVLSNDLDANDDTLLVDQIDTSSTIGVVQIEPGQTTLRYTPALNYNGMDSIRYTVVDGFGGSSVGTVFVTVLPVNDPPCINALADTLNCDVSSPQELNLWELTDDVESPDSLLIFECNSNPDSLILDFDTSNGILAIAPRDNSDGVVADLVISVTDPSGDNSSIIITVIIASPSAIYDNNYEPIPVMFSARPNYPNPFNPSTKIRFSLPKNETVVIEVFNIIGQKIETLLNRPMPAGYHEAVFNGQNLSSGVYLYKIEAGAWQEVRKMLLAK